MFDHLDEDWPWLVVPAILIVLASIAAVILLGTDDSSMFTYPV